MKLVLAALLVAGCSTSDAQVAGTYTVNVTNRDNGCNFANWTVGNMTSGVSVAITQSGKAVTANVTGGVGVELDFAFGSSMFMGSVDGDSLDLKLMSTKAQTSGNCTFTYDGEIAASSSGDILTGRINYTPATNGHTECASIEGCITYQDFNGSRPPQ